MVALWLLACAGDTDTTAIDSVDTVATVTDSVPRDSQDTATPPTDTAPVAPWARMSDAQLLTRLSLDLRGVRPRLDELERLEADPTELDALVEAYLDDPLFGDRLMAVYDAIYHTDTRSFWVNFGSLFGEDWDSDFTRQVPISVGQAPLRLLRRVAEEDLPWTTIVTADWTMADHHLGRIYPVDYPDGETGWHPVSWTDQRPAGGVLVSTGFMQRYISQGVNFQRRRANELSRILLCGGGWDPALVFAPSVGADDGVDRDSEEVSSLGGHTWVSSPSRPAVDAFFAAHGAQTLLINGLEVRNVDHTICTHLAKTGGTGGDLPDWATIIAQERASDFIIPHLALGGPAFTGPFPTSVVRVSGTDALYQMLGGSLLTYSQDTVPLFESRSVLDDFAAARQQAVEAEGATGRRQALIADHGRSLDVMAQAEPYKDLLKASSSLSIQAANAVAVLESGLSRCVSLSQTYNGYDSHTSNFWYQESYQNELFTVLDELMTLLASTAGTSGGSLLDETTVVVHSEMGKTPQLNSGGGKDHWPYTSTMLLGAGVTGDRVVGAYDGALAGRPVDLGTAELSDSGQVMTASTLGATFLALADVDPGDWGLDSDPLTGVLA